MKERKIIDSQILKTSKEKQKVPHSYSRAEESARFANGVRDDDLLIKRRSCISHAIQTVPLLLLPHSCISMCVALRKHVCSTKNPSIRPNDKPALSARSGLMLEKLQFRLHLLYLKKTEHYLVNQTLYLNQKVTRRNI